MSLRRLKDMIKHRRKIYMDYFLLKQSGNISIPRTKDNKHDEPSIRIMQDISQLDRFDYLAAESLVSDRMKLLLEQYLLNSEWQPCAFVEPSKKLQKIFWFLPPLSYFPEQVTTAPNGTVCSIHVKKEDFCKKSPGIFRIPNPKGTPSVIVHLSVAESILRRGLCGLELVRLSG